MFPSQIEFLRHILKECDYLARESESNGFEDFLQNERLTKAICRSLEIIGEACIKVHPDLKAVYPMVEWRAIGDMRNKIIHFYFGIDYDIVWDTVKTDIPVLRQQIQSILFELSNDNV